MCKQTNTEKPPEYQAGFSYALYLFSYVERNVNILLVFPCYPSIWCFFPLLYPHRELDPNFFSVQNLSLFVLHFCPFLLCECLSPHAVLLLEFVSQSHTFHFYLFFNLKILKFLFSMMWTKNLGSSTLTAYHYWWGLLREGFAVVSW